MSKVFFRSAAAISAAILISACATAPNNPNANTDIREAQAKSEAQAESYNENEVVAAISTHLGVTSESAASAIERLFKERGRPTAYITGEEGGGADGGGGEERGSDGCDDDGEGAVVAVER